jgi:NADPH:quinone reductase
MKAIQISEQGGPEVLNLIDMPVPQSQNSEVLVKNEAIGVKNGGRLAIRTRYSIPL